MRASKHISKRRCGDRCSCRAGRAQRGFSLFIVLIMLLLSALLAVGGARVAQLLESVAGNELDQQRAFEAAEAALLDAERDIRGLAFDTATQTYVGCEAVTPSPCRAAPTRLLPDPDVGATAYTSTSLNSCEQGICFFEGVAASAAASGTEAYQFWTKSDYKNESAAYGQYTGAPKAGNASLESAKYWIEAIFRRQGKPIYRVTAIAEGARSSAGGATRVVLQMSIDPNPVRHVN